MSKHSNDLTRWRSCAKQARAVAERLKIRDAKLLMYEIAIDYEHLAERAERQLADKNVRKSA
jgi:hypothetical protein